MIKDVNSLINHADFSFQRLDYIQDAALGLINIEQNEIVKIFSVAAVIFMPATLIASIYGMNFKVHARTGLDADARQRLEHPLGYIFAIGLMIFCSALTIWYFKYKNGSDTSSSGRTRIAPKRTKGAVLYTAPFVISCGDTSGNLQPIRR